MFNGFSDKTSAFLWELSFNNERPWFLLHKQEFEEVLNTPFKELAKDTMAIMEQRFPGKGLSLHISRIYRDARRLFGGGPYKDHLWFSIKSSAALLDGPMFWFEVGAKDYSYGMGFYNASARQMEAFRRSVDANPSRFERMAKAIEREKDFVVTGEEYARPKAERSGVIGKWYNRRRLGIEVSRDFGGELMEAGLPMMLADAYEKLMPMYDFFVEFYQAEPPKEQKR